MVDRPQRPNCEICHHSISFHGDDEVCRALGCRCSHYEGQTRLGHQTMAVEEAMFLLGLSREQVMALNAETYGLAQHEERALSTDSDNPRLVWRLDRMKISEQMDNSKNPC